MKFPQHISPLGSSGVLGTFWTWWQWDGGAPLHQWESPDQKYFQFLEFHRNLLCAISRILGRWVKVPLCTSGRMGPIHHFNCRAGFGGILEISWRTPVVPSTMEPHLSRYSMAQALAAKKKLNKKPLEQPSLVSPLPSKNCRTCHDGLGGGHQCPGPCAGPENCPLRYTNPPKWQLCMFISLNFSIGSLFLRPS